MSGKRFQRPTKWRFSKNCWAVLGIAFWKVSSKHGNKSETYKQIDKPEDTTKQKKYFLRTIPTLPDKQVAFLMRILLRKYKKNKHSKKPIRFSLTSITKFHFWWESLCESAKNAKSEKKHYDLYEQLFSWWNLLRKLLFFCFLHFYPRDLAILFFWDFLILR